jgi:hypothetical protein
MHPVIFWMWFCFPPFSTASCSCAHLRLTWSEQSLLRSNSLNFQPLVSTVPTKDYIIYRRQCINHSIISTPWSWTWGRLGCKMYVVPPACLEMYVYEWQCPVPVLAFRSVQPFQLCWSNFFPYLRGEHLHCRSFLRHLKGTGPQDRIKKFDRNEYF